MTRNYPSFVDAFMEYTKLVEAPEKFLRWSALSAISGALERKVWINFNGVASVYPNMYVMLVGSPGLAKKSSSSAMAVDLIKAIKDLRFMSTQMTAASLVLQLREAGANRYVTINNEKYHNSSLYLYSSEAAVTLKEITGSVTELLTDFYDCRPDGWNNEVSWAKETKSDGRIEIFNPCTNMLACSTPDWLVRAIGPEDIKGGFASRIIFVVQRGKPERSIGWVESMPDMSEMRRKLVQDLQQIANLTGQFKAEKSFGEAFNDFKRRHEMWLEKNTGDKMIGYHSRKPWHIMKLSQVLAVDQGNELIVTGDHWRKSEELLTHLEADMYYAFGNVGTNQNAQQIHTLWEYLRKKESFTKQEVLAMFWQDFDAKTLTEALATLKDMHRIDIEVTKGKLLYKVLDRTSI